MSEQQRLDGSRLAGYLVQHLIGRGGMGEVHRAIDERLGRPVALKLLRPDLAGDERFRERMLRESRLAASLDHPNVVPVYEAGEADDRLFIAMRYVDGTDLKALLRREGALAPQRVLAITAQVAAALDAAHRRGLVHRDVKPSNVLLDQQDGREHAYLADFGLTQSASDLGPADGQFMGTIDYVAPEQVRGDTIDGRADQYALACLMFECLTGDLPYRQGSDVAAIFAHLEAEPPSARERRPDLPDALDRVLARGMAKEPGDRYETCAGLVEDARAALGLEREARGRGRLIAAVACGLVALAAVAAILATRGGAPASAAQPTGALVRIDPRTNTVVSTTPVPGHPGAVAVTPGGVWAADFRGGTLWRYQPAGDALTAVPSNGEPRDIAAVGTKLFVASDEPPATGLVSRYDARSGQREASINILACALAGGDGLVWAAGCPFVQRLSTGPGAIRKLEEVFLPFLAPATVSNGRVQFREMVIGDGSLWVLGDALDRRMWRLDARTGEILATIPLAFPPHSVAVAGGRAWVTDALNDAVVPVSTRTNRPGAAIALGRGASSIAVAAGSLWVADTLDGELSRIDPVTSRVTATIRVGGLPRQIDGDDRGVWVTTHGA